jgi:acetylornithine deacetylase/succinyl-diaminopimelate desuccinylase-like protein
MTAPTFHNLLQTVLRQADDDFADHLARLQRYIGQHSVSALNDGVAEMAALLAGDIESLGGDAQVVPGVDFPVVFARIDAGAEKTVLIHGMYDTTPADPAEWVSPPFEGLCVDYAELGECIVGRGAEDTKGPMAATLAMIASHRAAGVALPVNLILIFEASELGSASLPSFIDAHLDELRDADVAYWPWHTQRADGTAVAWLGTKGIMTLKMRVRGGAWGGPVDAEAHGLHSIWVASPLHRLVAALASLKTGDDRDIAVAGFYDPVPAPTEQDEKLIAALAQRVDADALLREAGAERFKQDNLLEALRSYCLRTEINVSGVSGGTVIEGGHKVELPNEAVASLDIRPLDGMTVEHITTCLRNHLDGRGFHEVEIEVLSGYQGGAMPVDNWAVHTLLDTYRETGHDPEVWPRSSAGIASYQFIEKIGIPWIATTLGHSGHKHAPNEYLQVKGYRDAVGFIARLMWRLAEADPSAGHP